MNDHRAAVAGVFDRSADDYDSVGVDFFSIFGRHLVDDLGISPGERVLDVGCGRGAVLFPAAERVGAHGAVAGIDRAPRMVEHVAAEVRARGLRHVNVEVMDAQEPTLPPASFDVVASALVIFFLPDPLAALRAWRELLVAGGRLGFTTFAEDDEGWSWLDPLFAEFLPPGLRRPSRMSDDNPLASSENIERALHELGYRDVSNTVRVHETRFRDPQQWRRWSWSHGQRAMWEHVPDDRRNEVEEKAFVHLRRLQRDRGSITLRSAVRYTSARR